MSRSRVVFTLASVPALLLAAARCARADQDAETMRLRCTLASPDWGELDCVTRVDDRRDLADRTHISMFPSGNVLRKGEVQYQVHELGLFNRAAFGVTDSLELSASAPVFPVFATVGARAGLLPRESSYRVAIGAGLWLPLIGDEFEPLVQASATVAYQSDRVNLHATAGGIKPEGYENALLLYSAGLAYKVNRKGALFAEVLRLTMAHASDTCGDCVSDCGGGGSPDFFDGAMVGVKLMGKRFDTDLGLFLPFEDDSEIIGLPVVSMTYRY